MSVIIKYLKENQFHSSHKFQQQRITQGHLTGLTKGAGLVLTFSVLIHHMAETMWTALLTFRAYFL